MITASMTYWLIGLCLGVLFTKHFYGEYEDKRWLYAGACLFAILWLPILLYTNIRRKG